VSKAAVKLPFSPESAPVHNLNHEKLTSCRPFVTDLKEFFAVSNNVTSIFCHLEITFNFMLELLF